MNPTATSPHTQPADALVLLGATGDLAYKKIFPALYAMCRSGALSVPIIGVASSQWNDGKLRERARESIEKDGAEIDRTVLEKLLASLYYVCGDYRKAETFEDLKHALGGAQRPAY